MGISRAHDLLKRLLRRSVVSLCRETIPQEDTLEIDCIMVVTAEDETNQMVIQIHEKIGKSSLLSDKTKYGASCDEIMIQNDDEYRGTPPKLDKMDVFVKKEPVSVVDNGNNITDYVNVVSATGSENDMVTTENASMETAEADKSPDDMPHLNDGHSDTSPNGFNDNADDIAVNKTLCIKCNMNFASFEKLDAHNYTVHLTHTCNYCLQTFTSRPNMHRHIRRHTGYKPFACSICDSRFSRKDDHSIHVLKHRVAKPFVCSICNKDYTDRSCLRSHMKREHKQRLLHLCSHCGKGFGDPVEAENHRFDHTDHCGSGDFRCSRCPHVADSREALNIHATLHDRNELSYHCSECKKSFVNLEFYITHLQSSLLSHQTFPCPLCTLNFATFAEFESHQCDIDSRKLSNQRFTYNTLPSTSPIARVNKNNKRQYWCSECNLGFMVENDLNSHIETYHSRMVSHDNMEYADIPLYIDLCNTGLNRRNNEAAKNMGVKPGLSTVPKVPSLIDMRTLSPQIEKETTTRDNGAIDLSMGRKHFFPHTSKPLTDNSDEDFVPISPLYSNVFASNYTNQTLGSNRSVPTLHIATEQRTAPEPTQHIWTENTQTPLRISKKRKCNSLPDVTRKGSTVKVALSQRSPGSLSDSHANMSRLSDSSPTQSDVNAENPFSTSLFKFQNSYRCDFCPETFGNYGDYSGHSAAVHKRYVCDQCGMCFTAKPNRDRHRRYHTGERPYSCNLCHRSFFRGDDLKYHRTTRHIDTMSTEAIFANISSPSE